MGKPVVILDPNWRRVNELFSDVVLGELRAGFDVVWARDEAMPGSDLAAALGEAFALVQCEPVVNAAVLEAAPALRAVVEVSGAFPGTIDYAACAARGVEALSCSPGFRRSVAEMTLAMVLGAGRGLVAEHEAFRAGAENWLADCDGRDFTLHGAVIGFVGFGAIAREVLRLMAPFGVRALAYDPWQSAEAVAAAGAEKRELDAVLGGAQAVIVAAAPSRENKGLIGAEAVEMMAPGALLVAISRAHLIDFEAVVAAAVRGRIRFATDVFPSEPLAADHPVRRMPGVILSPHRAAAVPGGRHEIGELILHDLLALREGQAERTLAVADPAKIALTAGQGDAGGLAHFGGTQ